MLFQESNPPSSYTGNMVAGFGNIGFPNIFTGYSSFSPTIGNLSPAIFEGLEITAIRHHIASNLHILGFLPSRPSPDLTSIKINETEYSLTIFDTKFYTFSPGSSLFVNGQSYTIEFIR